MPKFLNEHQVGFDTTLIGFPNLGDCLAVVLQNEGGLFGFHITPGNARQSGEFARFIQNSVNLGPNSTHLYGSCYRPNRYNKKPAEQWREEMIEIADAIGYRGPISGFDTSKGTNIKRTETTYLEYRLGGDSRCAVYYKRMSKMDVVGNFGGLDPDVALIRRDMANTTDVWKPAFKLTDTKTSQLTTSADVKVTKSNKGEMHAVKPGELDTFAYTG